MEIFTLAYDTDYGTGATVHMTEREAHLRLIQENVSEENREEALKQLDGDEEDGFDFWEWFDENEREPMDTFSIESHEIDVPAAPFNDRERKVLLSVLHQYADDQHEGGGFEGSDITEEEIDTLCERLNLGKNQPKPRVVVRVEGGTVEFLENPDEIETVLIDYDEIGQYTGAALESAISHFPADLQPAIREYFFVEEDSLISEQEGTPDVLTCEDFDPDEEANRESAGRIIDETARQMKRIESSLPPDPEGENDERAEWAEAAIIAFESETGTDREYWPTCPNCGSNLAEEDAPDDGTDPSTHLCASCKAGLPPDPEGQNNYRAEWANDAIEAFIAATNTDKEDALADLLGDLHHWADRNGQDFDAQLDRARRYYAQETQTEPEPQEEPVKELHLLNHYRCPKDGYEWDSEWSCACNDRCPVCNSEIEPYETEDMGAINPLSVAAMTDKLGKIL